MKCQVLIRVPVKLRAGLSAAAEGANLSVNEFVCKLISQAVKTYQGQTLYEKRGKDSITSIPQGTVRKLLEERQKDPPTPYRELARKYGYALRTVHRACTGQGGYRIKVKRTMLGRKSRLSSEQLAAILIDSQTMTIAELAKKYPVSRRTLCRAIAGEGCYARKS